MSDTALRCRTCTTAIERLQGDRGKLVGICPRCADRTQARCGVCRQPLSVRGELGVCACGRRWSFASGRLEPIATNAAQADDAIAEPPRAPPIPSPPPTPTPVPSPSSGVDAPELGALRIREERVPRREAGGYREALTTAVLTIELGERRSSPTTEIAPPTDPLSSRSIAIVLGVAALAVAATIFISRDEVVSFLVCIGVSMCVFVAFALVVGFVPPRTRGRAPQSVRIDEELVSRLQGDRWVELAPTASLTRAGVIYPQITEEDQRLNLKPPGAQVIVERTSGRPILLMQELDEGEAVEIVRRVRAFLETMRKN